MRGLIRLLFVIGLAYGGWRKFQSASSRRELAVIVQADGQLSEGARETLQVYVHSLLKKALPLNEIGYLLREAFPHIAHVAVSKDPLKKIRVAVSLSSPMALCNGSMVLCSNDTVVSKDIFNNKKLTQLPEYQVDEAQFKDVERLNDFKEFVTTCDADLHSQYRIAWNNPQSIYLHDKQEPKITLVLDQDSVKNMKSVAYAYNTIKQSLMEQSLQKNKKNKLLAWHVDGRFKNQIIVVPKGVVG